MRSFVLTSLASLTLMACDPTTGKDDSGAGETADTSGGGGVDVSLRFSGDDVVDATPDATGETIWYLDGDALCQGPADGSADATCSEDLVHEGKNLVISPDGERMALAGEAPTQLVGAAGVIGGLIGSLFGGRHSAEGTSGFTLIEGTQGYEAAAVDYPAADTGYVYFSGQDPATGTVGVFKVAEGGGTPVLVASGMSSVPTGIVVAEDGTVYSAADGSLYEGDTAIVSDLTLGEPAGLALTPDESTVMVSAVGDGHSEAVLVNRTDRSTSIFDDVISANVGSGGLHRAQGVPTLYAWCGVTSTTSGGVVYRISF